MQDEQSFQNSVLENPHAWVKYCELAYAYMESQDATIKNLNDQIETLKKDTFQASVAERATALALDDKKAQLAAREAELMEIKIELRMARQSAPWTETTPTSTPNPSAEVPVAAPIEYHTPPATTSAPAVRISEKIPDPAPFEGDRTDLRRFSAQVRQKMITNRDRFYDAQARISYVTSRLVGAPYSQILPYIVRGRCTLDDYEDVLSILESAYGDPNRTRNARRDLFRLRQKNSDYASFFAEFHRLALESEIDENALPALLEEAVSYELKDMAIHHDPPTTGGYLALGKYYQDLDNRLRSRPVSRFPWKGKTTSQDSSPHSPARGRSPPRARLPPGDPMDLSAQRRAAGGLSRKDNNLCFRCGSDSHFIRNCPLPDTRQTSRGSQDRLRQIRTVALRDDSLTPPPRSHTDSPHTRRTSQDRSENGDRLL